eukprot:SAG31_NODE_1624_length_7717_cov_43.227750_1_plen_66_part_00
MSVLLSIDPDQTSFSHGEDDYNVPIYVNLSSERSHGYTTAYWYSFSFSPRVAPCLEIIARRVGYG